MVRGLALASMPTNQECSEVLRMYSSATRIPLPPIWRNWGLDGWRDWGGRGDWLWILRLIGKVFRELVACFADPWGYCFDLLGGLWGNLGPWRGIWRARGTLECIVERAWKSFVSFEKC